MIDKKFCPLPFLPHIFGYFKARLTFLHSKTVENGSDRVKMKNFSNGQKFHSPTTKFLTNGACTSCLCALPLTPTG